MPKRIQLDVMATTSNRSLKNSTLLNAKQDFDQKWQQLKPLIQQLFTPNQVITTQEWQTIFWSVHNVCMWHMDQARILLSNIHAICAKYIETEREYIKAYAKANNAPTKAYVEAWSRFVFYYKFAPLPFAYLKRLYNKSQKMYTPPNGSQEDSQLVDEDDFIRDTLSELWKRKIFDYFCDDLIADVMNMVKKERNNLPSETHLICNVKESCLYLCGHLVDKLQLYRDQFERQYIEYTERFYYEQGGQYVEKYGLLQYMKWVETKIKEENERANRYLEPYSVSKVTSALVQTLIGGYKKDFVGQFISLIETNDVEHLRLMFSLLDRVENGIDPLLNMFKEKFLQDGLTDMKINCLTLLQDCEKYVELLLEQFNRATNLVVTAFKNDPRFLTARDIAFNTLINNKNVFLFALTMKQNMSNSKTTTTNPNPLGMSSSSNSVFEGGNTASTLASSVESLSLTQNIVDSSNNIISNPLQIVDSNGVELTPSLATIKLANSRCAELFANYCDMLLRKTNFSRHLTSEQVETKLKNINLLLKYVQDKDLFIQFYKAHLTRRLILDASADLDKDESMVDWLRNIGMPADVVSKLTRMFQDLKVSNDFNHNLRAKHHIELADVLSVKILNCNVWDRKFESIRLSLPLEIEEVLNRIRRIYQEQHTGRNLLWHHQFSSGVITFHSDFGNYDLECTAYQILVLLAWNDRMEDVITFDALHLTTQLPKAELKRTLWSLLSNPKLKVQLLCVKPEVKSAKDLHDSSKIKLNTQFMFYAKNGKSLKRSRINLIGRLQLTSEKTHEEEAESIYQLRTLRTQEAIIQVMKTRKSLKIDALHLELANVLKAMFIPSKALIKEQVDWLLKQEYIKLDPNDKNIICHI